MKEKMKEVLAQALGAGGTLLLLMGTTWGMLTFVDFLVK